MDSFIFGATWGDDLDVFGDEIRDKARAFGMDPKEYKTLRKKPIEELDLENKKRDEVKRYWYDFIIIN